MAEHIRAGLAVGHVLVGIGAEVDVGVEATCLQHFHQHRHDVTMDAFEAIEDHVDGRTILFP